MADIKVTQLPELTTPTDDDILPIIDSPSSGATTKKITKANLVASTVATITAHTSRTDNPHTVTKAQVGLGSAENTVDSAKPVSTATQTALDAKAALVHAHAQSDVTGLTTCAGRLLHPWADPGTLAIDCQKTASDRVNGQHRPPSRLRESRVAPHGSTSWPGQLAV